MTNIEIEELATVLMEIYWNCSRDDLKLNREVNSINLARFVAARVVEARIEELKPFTNKPIGTTFYRNSFDFRVENLEKQLTALRGKEKT